MAALDDFDEIRGAAAVIVRFELSMLAELGVGLDLSSCAATGATEELIYVSPKSGGAVSRSAGAPYADRLLRLPGFLAQAFVQDVAQDVAQGFAEDSFPGEGGFAPGKNAHTVEELRDGFALTGTFLLRHVLEPRGQAHSDARIGFIAALSRVSRAIPA